MALLSAIVTVLLTLVSYSSGITLATPSDRDFLPTIFDLITAFLLWIVAFWLRSQLGRWWGLAAIIVVGIVVGFVLAKIRQVRSDPKNIIPKSELPEHAQEKAAAATLTNPFKRLWRAWSEFSARMGSVQGRLLMGFFYFFIVTPFGLGFRLLSDPLTLKMKPENSNWLPREQVETTLTAAQEQ
ncbi:MAG: hypothetical protein GY796_02335 [Chloroflexi bacterium]|nr:hypothetical protein [Chloroflexota bacterium]